MSDETEKKEVEDGPKLHPLLAAFQDMAKVAKVAHDLRRETKQMVNVWLVEETD